MAELLNVSKRSERGTLRMKRLRQSGKVPAILYGHGKESISLAIDTKDVHSAIRHGSHFVQLSGELTESALIKMIQWDQLGSDIMHVDLTRAKADETIEIEVPVELKGDAPGTREGGVVNHILHSLMIRCSAASIPEKLEVNINSLELDGALTTEDIEFPEGTAAVDTEPQLVVQCAAPTVRDEEEEADGDASAAEPEVIGRKRDDEDEADEG